MTGPEPAPPQKRIRDVQGVLLSAPEAIRRTVLEAWSHKEKREAALLKAKLREADVLVSIAEAWRKEGRKSNEAEREAEARRVLSNDAIYHEARREAEDEKALCARIEAALDFHRNRLRAAEALSRATGNLDLQFPEDP